MKLTSLFVFLGSLYWTWGLIHPLPMINPEIQESIQNQIQIIISKAVQKRHQQAQNIQFNKIESESLNDREILVTFDYQFRRPSKKEEGFTKSTVKGNVLVKLAHENAHSLPQWKLENLETLSSKVEFEQGSKISVDQ